MASFYQYYVHQDFTSNPDIFPSQPHINLFNIELLFTHFVQLFYPETLEIPDVIYREAYAIPRDRLLSDQEGPRIIASILSSTGSSSELLEIAVPDILGFAWEMERNPNNSGQRVLTMVINLSVVTPFDDREAIDRAINESFAEVAVPKFRAASKESIEKHLETVRLQDLGHSAKQQQCMVCLEEFDDHVGNNLEISRMPCGHVYHGGCIVKWLETNNTCPLCRYKIPC